MTDRSYSRLIAGGLPLCAGEAFSAAARGHAPRFTPSTHTRTSCGCPPGGSLGKVLLKQKNRASARRPLTLCVPCTPTDCSTPFNAVVLYGIITVTAIQYSTVEVSNETTFNVYERERDARCAFHVCCSMRARVASPAHLILCIRSLRSDNLFYADARHVVRWIRCMRSRSLRHPTDVLS